MRIRTSGTLFSLLLVLVASGLVAEAPPKAGVLSFWVKNREGAREIADSGYYLASSGDQFQFKVTVPSKGVVWVFHFPPEGGVTALGSTRLDQRGEFSYPASRRWFTLTGEAGQEEFLFLASGKPIPQLEPLLKDGQKEALFAYLRSLKAKNSRIAEVSREPAGFLGAPLRAAEGILIPIPENDVSVQSFFLVH